MYRVEAERATKATKHAVQKMSTGSTGILTMACHDDGLNELNFLAELFLRVSGCSIRDVSEVRPADQFPPATGAAPAPYLSTLIQVFRSPALPI